MSKITIVGHQGFGDFFSQNAIYNYHIDNNKEIVIFALDNKRKILLEHMFFDKKNVKIVVPEMVHYNECDCQTCMICMTFGNVNKCPRNGEKCLYIDYSYYNKYKHIKLASFDNYEKWSNFIINSYSFSHAFYLYHNYKISMRIELFNVYRNIKHEKNIYDEYVKSINYNKYMIIHDSMQYKLNISNEKNYEIYNLDNASDNMIDQLMLIENSEEIHLLDSSYSCLIYFMCLKFNFYKNKKIYIHAYARESDRNINIYKNPQPENFIILL
jgi:hypothetical protein